MNTNHTPGPWAVVDGCYPCFREVIGASFKISAVMSASDLTENDYLRRSADLNLIAAAPLMLEALKEIVAAADGRGWSQLDPSLSRARAAIAAATN